MHPCIDFSANSKITFFYGFTEYMINQISGIAALCFSAARIDILPAVLPLKNKENSISVIFGKLLFLRGCKRLKE